MGLATGIATIGSIWVLSGKAHFNSWQGMIPAAGLGLLVILLVLGAPRLSRTKKANEIRDYRFGHDCPVSRKAIEAMPGSELRSIYSRTRLAQGRLAKSSDAKPLTTSMPFSG